MRLENVEEIKCYFIEEINQNELMSKKQKRNCAVLNCIENLLVFTSAVIECVFISTFAYLFGFPLVLTSSALGLKNCTITSQ